MSHKNQNPAGDFDVSAEPKKAAQAVKQAAPVKPKTDKVTPASQQGLPVVNFAASDLRAQQNAQNAHARNQRILALARQSQDIRSLLEENKRLKDELAKKTVSQ